MKLVRLLANLGYGSRRQVAALLAQGRVTGDGKRLNTHANFQPHRVSFTPHLVPMARGILATVSVPSPPCDCPKTPRTAMWVGPPADRKRTSNGVPPPRLALARYSSNKITSSP